jgi:peptide/nickel transport system substrate-binding protein
VFSGLPVGLDPALHRVTVAFGEAAAMAPIFGHLAYFNAVDGAVELYFLESLEPDDTGAVWTMRLHPDIKFSDGTPLDAEAIKYNIERSADPATGSRFEPEARDLVLEVLDELTLQVTLPEPNLGWDAVLVTNFAGVGSPTAIQAALDEGVEVGTVPVGAGPFMVTEWEPRARMVLEPNPYFGDFLPGQPYLDQLTLMNVDDHSQQTSAIASGAAQLALSFGGAATEALLEAGDAVVTNGSGGASITFNVDRPPFDDIRARMALSLAVDRSILSDAFQTGTAASTGLFPEHSPHHNPDLTWPDQDVEEAQRLLDELAAEGKPLEFSYTTFDSPQQQAVINVLISQLAEFDNVTFTPDVRVYGEYIASMQRGDFQSLCSGIYFVNPMPIMYDSLHPDGLLNYSNWVNEAVGEAFDDLASASTLEEQNVQWDIIQEQLIAEMPALWLGQPPITVGFSDDMVVPRAINIGSIPLFGEVGYKA